jgi:SpoVK/Ycf46/Vps4 family AAA+-type ATPase
MQKIVSDILSERNGGPKVPLQRIKVFIQSNPVLFSNVIDISKIDDISPMKRRKYILDRIVPVLQHNAKKKTASPAKVQQRKSKSAPAVKIAIEVKPASKTYLKELQSELEHLDTNNYSIEALEKGLKTDDFLQRAVQAHDQALLYKLKVYKKLSRLNWGEEVKKDPFGQAPTPVNLNEFIPKLAQTIYEEIQKRNKLSMQDKMKMKQADLKSILFDPDHGIATIQGKSRSNVRLMLLKTMYMFFKVPEFFFKGFINFMITGPAGSGKTKVAGVIAHMFKHLGILANTKVIMATKQNLVAGYVGQTGPKTRAVLVNALEGVLFIDEAYSLAPCPSEAGQGAHVSFSEESVAEIINFLDKFIGCMVVIVAGYKDKMYDCFLTFNEGLGRRFPKTIDFIPYTSDDLYNMMLLFMNESVNAQQLFTKHHLAVIKGLIVALNDNQVFNNQAGDMLNLAKMLAEEVVLTGPSFDDARIKLLFRKFCASKNMAIHFE